MGNNLEVQYANCQHFTLQTSHCCLCNQSACKKCFSYPLFMYKSSPKLQDIHFKTACKKCFIQQTEMDFTKNYQIIGEQNIIEILFIHSQGFNRQMFMPHARQLLKAGIRSILIDLPGHGSRINQLLTKHNCIKVIKESLQTLCKTSKVAIVAAGFGALMALQMIGQHHPLSITLILISCDLKQPLNSNISEIISSYFINLSSSINSASQLGQKYLKTLKSNHNYYESMIISLFKQGFYNNKQQQFLSILRSVKSVSHLKKTDKDLSILCIYAQSQYRELFYECLDMMGPCSKFLVYEKAPILFLYDERFFFRLLNDVKGHIMPRQ